MFRPMNFHWCAAEKPLNTVARWLFGGGGVSQCPGERDEEDEEDGEVEEDTELGGWSSLVMMEEEDDPEGSLKERACKEGWFCGSPGEAGEGVGDDDDDDDEALAVLVVVVEDDDDDDDDADEVEVEVGVVEAGLDCCSMGMEKD